MTLINLDQALLDPAQVFETPEAVLEEAGLTREQKAEILRRWQYNAAEEDVALEEGMQGSESGMMRRILLALEQVADGIDINHSGPNKQHGLPRSK
jgi:dihydroorotate dehydrogenase